MSSGDRRPRSTSRRWCPRTITRRSRAVDQRTTSSKRRYRQIIDFDKDAAAYRDAGEPRLADSMLAALPRLRANAKASARRRRANASSTTTARPLGGIPERQPTTCPNSPSGAPPPTRPAAPSRPAVSGRVPAQRLPIRSGSRAGGARRAGQLPQAPARSPARQPEFERGKDPLLRRSCWQDAGPLHRRRADEQIASLAAARKDCANALLAQPAEWKRRCPPRKFPWPAPSKRARPWTRRSSSAAIITTSATPSTAPFPRSSPASARPRVKTKSGRLELADWMVDPRNPLPRA